MARLSFCLNLFRRQQQSYSSTVNISQTMTSNLNNISIFSSKKRLKIKFTKKFKKNKKHTLTINTTSKDV